MKNVLIMYQHFEKEFGLSNVDIIELSDIVFQQYMANRKELPKKSL